MIAAMLEALSGCQFRGVPEIRAAAVAFIRSNSSLKDTSCLEEWCKKMSKPREYGDEILFSGLVCCLNVEVIQVSHFGDQSLWRWFKPSGQFVNEKIYGPPRRISLSLIHQHYGSMSNPYLWPPFPMQCWICQPKFNLPTQTVDFEPRRDNLIPIYVDVDGDSQPAPDGPRTLEELQRSRGAFGTPYPAGRLLPQPSSHPPGPQPHPLPSGPPRTQPSFHPPGPQPSFHPPGSVPLAHISRQNPRGPTLPIPDAESNYIHPGPKEPTTADPLVTYDLQPLQWPVEAGMFLEHLFFWHPEKKIPFFDLTAFSAKYFDKRPYSTLIKVGFSYPFEKITFKNFSPNPNSQEHTFVPMSSYLILLQKHLDEEKQKLVCRWLNKMPLILPPVSPPTVTPAPEVKGPNSLPVPPFRPFPLTGNSSYQHRKQIFFKSRANPCHSWAEKIEPHLVPASHNPSLVSGTELSKDWALVHFPTYASVYGVNSQEVLETYYTQTVAGKGQLGSMLTKIASESKKLPEELKKGAKEFLTAYPRLRGKLFEIDYCTWLEAYDEAFFNTSQWKSFTRVAGPSFSPLGPENSRRVLMAANRFLEQELVKWSILKDKSRSLVVQNVDAVVDLWVRSIWYAGQVLPVKNGKMTFEFRITWDGRGCGVVVCGCPKHSFYQSQLWKNNFPFVLFDGEPESEIKNPDRCKPLFDFFTRYADQVHSIQVVDLQGVIQEVFIDVVASPDFKAKMAAYVNDGENKLKQQKAVMEIELLNLAVQLVHPADEHDRTLEQDVAIAVAGNSHMDPRYQPSRGFKVTLTEKQQIQASIKPFILTDKNFPRADYPVHLLYHDLFDENHFVKNDVFAACEALLRTRCENFVQCCDKCDCTSEHVQLSVRYPEFGIWHRGRSHFDNVFGIPKEKFGDCVMHCTQRLTEKHLSISILNKTDDVIATDCLIKWCKEINKTKLAEPLGLKLGESDGYDWDGFSINLKEVKFSDEEKIIFEKSKIGMIMWKQCRVVVKTHKLWIAHLNQHMALHNPAKYDLKDKSYISKSEQELWSALDEAWDVLHATQDQVQEWKKAHYAVPKQILEKYRILILTHYKVDPKYYKWKWHDVFVHTFEQWDKFGSFLQIQNQGSEASNPHHKSLVEDGAGFGFGMSPHIPILQYHLRNLMYKIPPFRQKLNHFVLFFLKQWGSQCHKRKYLPNTTKEQQRVRKQQQLAGTQNPSYRRVSRRDNKRRRIGEPEPQSEPQPEPQGQDDEMLDGAENQDPEPQNQDHEMLDGDENQGDPCLEDLEEVPFDFELEYLLVQQLAGDSESWFLDGNESGYV